MNNITIYPASVSSMCEYIESKQNEHNRIIAVFNNEGYKYKYKITIASISINKIDISKIKNTLEAITNQSESQFSIVVFSNKSKLNRVNTYQIKKTAIEAANHIFGDVLEGVIKMLLSIDSNSIESFSHYLSLYGRQNDDWRHFIHEVLTLKYKKTSKDVERIEISNRANEEKYMTSTLHEVFTVINSMTSISDEGLNDAKTRHYLITAVYILCSGAFNHRVRSIDYMTSKQESLSQFRRSAYQLIVDVCTRDILRDKNKRWTISLQYGYDFVINMLLRHGKLNNPNKETIEIEMLQLCRFYKISSQLVNDYLLLLNMVHIGGISQMKVIKDGNWLEFKFNSEQFAALLRDLINYNGEVVVLGLQGIDRFRELGITEWELDRNDACYVMNKTSEDGKWPKVIRPTTSSMMLDIIRQLSTSPNSNIVAGVPQDIYSVVAGKNDESGSKTCETNKLTVFGSIIDEHDESIKP